MRKRIPIYYILLGLCWLAVSGGTARAQVSHGGSPLPLSAFRAADDASMYVEMPSFDVEEELRLDSLERGDFRNGYRFAYKFMTDYDRGNSGVTFTTPDGTRVWRLGIHSPGARSINVLFSEYELPEGARLFLYNADQSQVLGAFNHLNNSDLGLLPVAPVEGDRVVIEYQEPAGVAFPGRLRVGEVNHAYRDWRGMEPGDDLASISAIPPLACYDDGTLDYARWGRSVVLLIIDGTIGCAGCLLNNTEGDGKPYLLTASHCLNNQFQVKNPDYAEVAGRVVCFFNYDSPFCDPVTRGTEEMSMASSYFRAVNEMGDMALLELTDIPPVYYRPYYAGWNAGSSGSAPYTCVQHPQYSVKRLAREDDALGRATFADPRMLFYEDGHWRVDRWEIGYTASGSSGAPLFNADGQVIGGLSGGRSTQANPVSDLFFSLGSSWDTIDAPDRQLACWLDPSGEGARVCAGMDPYGAAPCSRLSNVYDSGRREEAERASYPGSGEAPLFGNNPDGIAECVEEYTLSGAATLYGVYLVTAPAGERYRDLEVEVAVYDGGDSGPGALLRSETFRPAYLNESMLGDFQETPKSLNRSQESFVRFSEPVSVGGTFYVGYRIKSAPEDTYFSAYSLPRGATARNTAWVRPEGGAWTRATDYARAGFATSLYVDPVVRYGGWVANEPVEAPGAEPIVSVGPGRGEVHIVLPEDMREASYALHAASGKRVAAGTIAAPRATLRLTPKERGVYILTISGEGKRYSQKIVL